MKKYIEIIKTNIRVILPTMFGTIMGIILTFGVSQLESSSRKAKMQKMVIMNVIHDLNDAHRIIIKDSVQWSDELSALNKAYKYIEHTSQEKLCVDSMSVIKDIFRDYYEYAAANSTDIMLKSDLSILENLDGSPIIRFINWSYDNGNAYFEKRKHVYNLKKHIESKVNRLYYVDNSANEVNNLKEILLMEETINYSQELRILIEKDILSQHSRLMRGSKEIIMEYYGITPDEYNSFCNGLNESFHNLNVKTTHFYEEEKEAHLN